MFSTSQKRFEREIIIISFNATTGTANKTKTERTHTHPNILEESL